ncbi:NAD(P)-binding protein [Ascoidea rubescens DSM 1968]|uniref:NAD(P)-binding protein n=1 Tax=Ascoidea rubescens DSM 1968 TaxID=1344418 RepID=A0A1D2VQ14_9ASCO|nr:NAD(P)-binding protein [Ascoidea rubescens DSM 1968]ODV63689.1 NAD(P)-binding protein [Ascoidea rubescens DSM 1968]
MSSKSSVLVTGGSGFVALHVIDTLLSKGYTVVATFRSKEKADPVLAGFNKKYSDSIKGRLSYVIVKDITHKEEFDQVFKADKSIKYVIHTAANFSFGFNKPLEEVYLNPARDGALNVLNSIVEYAPQVTNVVVTSSFAAILNGDKLGDKSFVHTEETWNPLNWDDPSNNNENSAYVISKKVAEKASWDFVKEKKPNFQLTSVNPPFIFGPQLFEDSLKNETLNTSAEVINKLLKTTPKDDETDPEQFSKRFLLAVDVRDVALFHVLPLENSKLEGKREFIAESKFSDQKLLNLINENFPALNGKIAKGIPSNIDKLDKNNVYYDSSKTLELSGVKLIPLKKTIVDSVNQILDYKKKHSTS